MYVVVVENSLHEVNTKYIDVERKGRELQGPKDELRILQSKVKILEMENTALKERDSMR